MTVPEKPSYEDLQKRVLELEKKESECNLLKSRLNHAVMEARRFRDALDHVSSFIYIKDTQFRYVYANRPTLELFACSAEELAGSDDNRFFPPETVKRLRAIDSRVLSGEKTAEEIDVADMRGVRRVYWEIKTPIYTQPEDRTPWGLLGISTDITDRKRIEDALTESEKNYRQVVDSIFETLSIVDADGVLLFANNKAAYDVSRGLPEDVVGKNIRDFIPIEQADRLIELYKRVISTNEPLQQEIKLSLSKGDTWFLNTMQPIPFGPEKKPAVMSISMDITKRKRAKKALRENEAFIRAVMDNLPIGVAVNSIDPGVQFQYMNDNFPKIYRTTREALSRPGSFWNAVYEDSEFREKLKRKVLDDCASGDPKRMKWTDIPIVRKGEETSYITASNTPISGKELMISTVWDVTDRKQTEDALRQSEIHYRSIFDNTIDAFLFTSPDGSIHDANPAACNMFGLTVEEIKKLGRSGIVDNTDPRLHAALEERARTGKTKAEITMVRADKTKFPTEISSVVFTDHTGLKKTSMVIRDITERKNAERSLRESEEKFHLAFQTSPHIITISRLADGKIIDINDTFTAITGYTKDEALASSTIELKIWADEEERKQTLAVLRKEGIVSARGIHFKGKNGQPLTALYSAELVLLNDELCIFSNIVDITEQKRSEEEREKLQIQLTQAQKMESIGRLAGGVAHDFNNMLNVIIGYSQLAMEKIPSTDPVYSDLTEIYSAGRRSAEIVRQLLAFARKQTIVPEVIDLNETVEGMLKTLSRLIGENIELVWLPGNDLWLVLMDPSQVDQIMANLYVNARDAIKDIGRIVIKTENDILNISGCTDLPGCTAGEYVLLTVSDNGSGMDRETLLHIFEPFFTTKEKHKGTGLGLATVYGIVTQNNGFITVDSEPGKGSSFKIYLPRCLGKKTDAEQPDMLEITEDVRETIIVVEDDASVLELIKVILSNTGYGVLSANTPEKAISLAKKYKGRIDLLITDMVMPEMNGRDLSKRITALIPELKTLYMSGYTTDTITHEGILEPGFQFIQKPFLSRSFLKKVRETLGA